MKPSCIKKDILATLTYFNMFDYPLTKREISVFLGHTVQWPEFEQALNLLVNERAIFRMEDFYSLNDHHTLVTRRNRGNEKAGVMLKQAEKAAAVLSAFPFVIGVAVSGSLSKRFADDAADIDFFIITSANRLWLARSFLHAFKKITYLFNKQHLYCMNYFIDEAEPRILEENIYTATEVATILPLRGSAVFEMFYSANKWTKDFLPNNYMHIFCPKEIKRTWIRSITEKILDNQVGNFLDNFLMTLTAKSWDAKTRRNRKTGKGILMSLHTGKHFAKPHPANFQRRLLQRYSKSLEEVLDQYELSGKLKNKLL